MKSLQYRQKIGFQDEKLSIVDEKKTKKNS